MVAGGRAGRGPAAGRTPRCLVRRAVRRFRAAAGAARRSAAAAAAAQATAMTVSGPADPGPDPAEREVEPLLEPRDGLPPLVDTASALQTAIDSLAGGSGPVAVDAERASGFRY